MTDAESYANPVTAILDPMPGYQRLALIRNSILTDIWFRDLSDFTPQYGSIFMARIASIHSSHGRIQLHLGQMGIASMRSTNPAQFTIGQLIPVTVQAEPREQKPAQMRYGIIRETQVAIIHYLPGKSGQLHLSQRLKVKLKNQPELGFITCLDELRALAFDSGCQITLRQSAGQHSAEIILTNIRSQLSAIDHLMAEAQTRQDTGMMASAPSLLDLAQQHFLIQHPIIDHHGKYWQEAEIDQQIDAALAASLPIKPGGGIIHISTPPGAAVIDGDSGESRLSPDALAKAMVDPLAIQTRLRRISGPIVVDFPRLDRKGRDQTHQAMMASFTDDPLHPILYGWTKGGLYTLERRHQLRPLSTIIDGKDMAVKQAAITGLRQIWQQGNEASRDGLPLQIRLSKASMDWLDGEGGKIRDAVCEDLPLPPEWITVQ